MTLHPEAEFTWAERYGRQWSVAEVVDLVLSHIGPREIIERGIELHETMDSPVSSAELTKRLGWRPRITMEAGVADIFGGRDEEKRTA